MVLGDLVTLQTGPFGSSLHQSDYVTNGVPLVNPMHIVGGRVRATEEHTVSAETAQRLSDFRLSAGDVVIGRRGEMGRCAVVTPREHGWLCGTGSMVIRCGEALVPTFLQRLLSSREIVEYLGQESVGSTMANLNQKVLLAVPVRVPPVAEQHRIVDSIDELMPDHEAGVGELIVALSKLTQYRQSLLKAAVEGDLTAGWRASNPPQETGAELLARILRERQVLGARNEPLAAHIPTAQSIPPGWAWASMDQLAWRIQNGCSRTPSGGPEGLPVLRISAVRPLAVDLRDVRYLADDTESAVDFLLEDGDLLATRYNGSVEYLGVVGVVRGLARPTAHPDKLIRIRPCMKGTLADWIEIAAAAGASRSHIVSRVKTTAGQTGIAGPDLRTMPIPLPPMQEQAECVRLLSEQLEAIAAQKAAVDRALQHAAAQRQNILRAAFSGQLVPQDPNDEPASVLLARIRAQRAAHAKSGKPPRRSQGTQAPAPA